MLGKLDPILGIFRKTEQSPGLLFVPEVLHWVKAIKDKVS